MFRSSRPRMHRKADRRRTRLARPLVELLEDRTVPSTFLVNSTDDLPDANPGDGLALDVNGNTTLRAAIMEANAIAGADNIHFNIPGTGVQTIRPLSGLPRIDEAVIIDGYTQTGASRNTLIVGNNAVLLIELDGSLAGAGISAIVVDASNCVLEGLTINRFGQTGVYVGGGVTNTTIAGNFIGTNVTGTLAQGNGMHGIQIFATNSNLVGGTSPGARNLISGNGGSGVSISGSFTKVQGNYIGTNAAGTAALGNVVNGVHSPGSFNTIGGDDDDDGLADGLIRARNLISGNGLHGIASSHGDIIQGNYVGTNAAGTAPLGNLVGILVAGQNILVGGTAETAVPIPVLNAGFEARFLNAPGGAFTFSYQDIPDWVISGVTATFKPGPDQFPGGVPEGVNVAAAGNSAGGGIITQTLAATLQANTTYALTVDVGQRLDFPLSTYAVELLAGGVTLASSSSLSPAAGTFLTDTIVFNSGSTPPQLGQNLEIRLSSTVGGQADFDNVRLFATPTGSGGGAGNLISGNSDVGVNVFHVNDGSKLQGNLIGTNFTGTAALPNRNEGVFLRGSNMLVGGTTPGARNVISGHNLGGLSADIRVEGATGSVIQGNYIATDITGMLSLEPGGGIGIRLIGGASQTLIGGNVSGARNVIAGTGWGIEISGPTHNNQVQGNYLGLAADGVTRLGLSNGVRISSAGNGAPHDNLIGGAAPGEANVISGAFAGVYIVGPDAYSATVSDNLVIGNLFGTNGTGTVVVGNTGAGVLIEGRASNNRIGTDGDGVNDLLEGNVIVGSNSVGGRAAVEIITLASGNIVAGNFIGTDRNGVANLGNNAHGVLVYNGSDNVIGGTLPGTGNVIAYSGGDGIAIDSAPASGNRLSQNVIFANAGLGIDLDNNGVTANDVGDADTSSNNLQNFPVLTSVVSSGGSTTITFNVNSTASTAFRVEFFANTAADPTGYGEGQRWLGHADVTTDGGGNVTFTKSGLAAVSSGEVVTATATGPDGTSEFSLAFTDVVFNQPPTADAGGPYIISEGQSLTLDASASDDPDEDTLTYSWDVNGDGTFGDAAGVNPTLTWAQLQALGINDGPAAFTVTVRASDGQLSDDSEPASLTVTNVTPTVTFTGPEDAVRGQTLTYSGSFTDPGADTWTATVNYGDGSGDHPLPLNPDKTFSFSHVYTASGTYQVTVTVHDGDPGGDGAVSLEVSVTDVALLPDPCHPGKTALFVGGTVGDDIIKIKRGNDDDDGDDADDADFVRVKINEKDFNVKVRYEFGPPIDRIIVFGQAGNDRIELVHSLPIRAELHGDAGDDDLKGGGSHDILLGGLGDDLLVGGQGRDLLIGGFGADKIVGNADDDILIAGTTAFDGDMTSLCLILEKWTSAADYATRTSDLRTDWLRAEAPDVTVFDDGARDVLTGSSGQDWFFAQLDGDNGSVKDKITDLSSAEFAADLDFIQS